MSIRGMFSAPLRLAAIAGMVVVALSFVGGASAQTPGQTATLYRPNGTAAGTVTAVTTNGYTQLTGTLTARPNTSYYVTDCITDPGTNQLGCPFSISGFATLFPAVIYPNPFILTSPYTTAINYYFTITTDANGNATISGTLPSFPAVSTVLISNVSDPGDTYQTVIVMSGSQSQGICFSFFC